MSKITPVFPFFVFWHHLKHKRPWLMFAGMLTEWYQRKLNSSTNE